ncbi:MAG: hydrogenase maturation nickel metallochaperone HypA [Anaerolineae bacterium]|nr:hydrogenase maturation nickel metallochaperone HypA [Anaerolineae bacterium]
MHELGVTEQLLSLALRHAEAADAKRIVALNLVIGEFSSVVDESLQFYWDFMAKGTIAENAELHFERVPGLFRCSECGHEFGMDDFEGRCPNCGGSQVSVVDGVQFSLANIEIE